MTRTFSSSWGISRDLPIRDVLRSYPVRRNLNSFFSRSVEIPDINLRFSLTSYKKPYPGTRTGPVTTPKYPCNNNVLKMCVCFTGFVRLEVSPVPDVVPGCLSPELIPVKPVSEKHPRAVKEVLEFPSSEVYVPHNIYR